MKLETCNLKLLVTGGSGYLGTHVRRFFEADDFSRRSHLDVLNPDEAAIAARYDVVIHLAAFSGEETNTVMAGASEAEAMDAYSRVVTGVAEAVSPAVVRIKVEDERGQSGEENDHQMTTVFSMILVGCAASGRASFHGDTTG